MKRKTIIHIDMNAYFASVEQAANPLLRGRPVAVGGGVSKRTVIATASYEARARGVKTAMPTWEALKICPDLIVVEGDMEKYIYTSKKNIRDHGKIYGPRGDILNRRSFS
jgi:DNA polymerase IV